MIIRKFRSLLRIISTYIKRKRSSFLAAKQLRSLAQTLNNPFFVIIMPGSLHIFKVFMRYAPETDRFVMILNGIDQWEKDWLHSHYPRFPEITLKTTLRHGHVIDLLIDHFKKPFGMIDSDCFITNLNYFEEIQVLPNDVMLNAFFVLRNEKLSLDIPQTHFLFFNPNLISKIKSKYKVTSDLYEYKQLPKKVKRKLLTLGIDSDTLPESATKLFDTMRVIMLLGILEGYRFNFLKRLPPGFVSEEQIHHIGASNYTDNIQRLSFFKGSYFWRRSLEKSSDQRLIDYYHKLRGQLTSHELMTMKPEFAGYSSTKVFVEFVEKSLMEIFNTKQLFCSITYVRRL